MLTGRALRNIARKPHYTDDILIQMDTIGVGSLPIVLLTGFFSRRRDGAADGPRARAIRADRTHRHKWSPSSWSANSGRC